jgi:hypothetical protein
MPRRAKQVKGEQIPPKIHALSELAIRVKLLYKTAEAQQDFIDRLILRNAVSRGDVEFRQILYYNVKILLMLG